jgi:2-polyprenyl-6-methoxyphenol hydroxylase-like FAD-dependent oxidoreductase
VEITVVGMGYVGTVAAACLADSGNDVVVVDINPTKIAQLNAGQSPVMEFGLAELIAHEVDQGRLRATDVSYTSGVDVSQPGYAHRCFEDGGRSGRGLACSLGAAACSRGLRPAARATLTASRRL